MRRKKGNRFPDGALIGNKSELKLQIEEHKAYNYFVCNLKSGVLFDRHVRRRIMYI